MKCNIVVIFTFVTLLLHCGTSSLSGVTDTGNIRVSAIMYNKSGGFAAGASVILRSADYLGSIDDNQCDTMYEKRETITDDSGNFYFDSLNPEHYFIEINDGQATAFLFSISFDESDKHDTTAVLSDTLQPYGAVRGRIDVKDFTNPPYIQIYGLERTLRVDTAGFFDFHDLPPGMFDFRIVTSDTLNSPIIIRDIAVEPENVTDLSFPSWSFSRKLVLNTGTTGADVAGSVTGFPVLVRLNAGNFDFESSRSDGADLRFVKPDGTTLPFAIERFDTVNKRAEIWVKVDTVHGSDSLQYITMYWGNPSASNGSNSSAVFDGADSVTAVWHMLQDCKDATGGGNDAEENSATDTIGIIGTCKKFKGNDSIMVPGLLGSPPNLTLSAWAQLDSVSGDGSEILSLGDAAMIRMDFVMNDHGTDGLVHQSENTVFYNIFSGRFLVGTGWHLITLTVNMEPNILTLFIDGEEVNTRTDLDATINYTGVGRNTYIGKQGNGKTDFNFIGRIDEVRAYSKALSPDYIKLSFMNQKADDALVIFK
ncbi:MAG: DUF2341 domain-containing protein [Chitinispirillaceae bacterium]|nr:DUF2341 domain-containing protein [Chitinispirillaceae bacterium]